MPQWFSSVLPLPGAPYAATERPSRAAANRNPSRSLLIFSTAAAKPSWPATVCRPEGSAAPVRDLASGFGTEELNLRGDATGVGRLGHIRGRLDAEHRDASRLEVLKQVTVVAGHLGDQAAGSQVQASDHRLRIPLRVL